MRPFAVSTAATSFPGASSDTDLANSPRATARGSDTTLRLTSCPPKIVFVLYWNAANQCVSVMDGESAYRPLSAHKTDINITLLKSVASAPLRDLILLLAVRHLLAVPRFRLNTYGRRTFSVAGPMAWNALPDFNRDPTGSSTDCFRHLLKTYLFARY